MVAKRSFLLVALVSTVVLALAPATAEARFGTRGGGSSGGHSSGGTSHGASGVGRSYFGPRYYGGGYRYYGWPSFYYGWGFGYYPYFGYYSPYYYPAYAYPVPEQPIVAQNAPRPIIHTTFSLEAQTLTTSGGSYFATDRGGIVGISARIEGERVGLNVQFNSIFPEWRDNFDAIVGDPAIKLFNLYVTYALISTPHSRLRIEAGLTSAFTRDLTTAGPGGGLSLVVNVFGPLGVEGAIHGTPFPYRQLDWNGGVALNFGPVGLHGGWRRIFLDDEGLVDGYRNKDSFSGPYAALTLTL